MAGVSSVRSQRSCIGCDRQDSKKELYRLVRTAEGDVQFDPTGRLPGRGAYVCSLDCLMAARKNRRLERALRVTVDDRSLDRIAQDLSRAACAATSSEE